MTRVYNAAKLLWITGVAECAHRNFVMFHNASSYNSTDMAYTPRYDKSGYSLTVLMSPAELYFPQAVGRDLNTVMARDGSGAQVDVQGSGGFMSLVSAAGAWDIGTLVGIGFCAAAAAFATPACVIALAGAIGLIVQYVVSEVKGHDNDSGSVSENARRQYLGSPTVCTAAMRISGGFYQECYDGADNLIMTHHVSGASDRTTHVVSMNDNFAGLGIDAVMNMTSVGKGTNRRRDEYEIEWISYSWDNVNRDLTGWFSDAYETNPDAFCKAIAGGIFMAPTTKYCLSMGEGTVYGEHSNAIHGELYTNAYGGVDGYCNQDNDNWGAVQCTNVVYIDNNQSEDWGCPKGGFI